MATRKGSRGTKDKEAELLLHKWLLSKGYLVHKAARAGFIRMPGGQSFCQSHDIFGCFDILALQKKGLCPPEFPQSWLLQVTTQAGLPARRKKIDAVSDKIPDNILISLVTHERTQDPANRSRSKNFWRMQNWNHDTKSWNEPTAVEFHAGEIRKITIRKKRD